MNAENCHLGFFAQNGLNTPSPAPGLTSALPSAEPYLTPSLEATILLSWENGRRFMVQPLQTCSRLTLLSCPPSKQSSGLGREQELLLAFTEYCLPGTNT